MDKLIHPVAARLDQGIQFTQTISLKRMMNSNAFRARESASLADKEQSNGISAKSMLPIIGTLAAVSKEICESSLLIGGFSSHLSNYPNEPREATRDRAIAAPILRSLKGAPLLCKWSH